MLPAMFEVTCLGTSASIPTASRSLPAFLVEHEGLRFLVDCGEATQLRLMQAGESLKIPHILLTHDHLDHILGLAGLLFSLSLLRMQPTPQVTIYGGNTTLKRARILANMIRANEQSPVYVDLAFVEVSPGVVLEDDRLKVSAFPTDHRELRPSFGYAFETKGRNSVKLVFSGDTRYTDALVQAAKGADCLVAEANYASDKETQAEKYGHLTAAQAARIAAAAGAKCLMLTHISREYADNLAAVLAEASAIFPNTLLPNDLDSFTISRNGVTHATGKR